MLWRRFVCFTAMTFMMAACGAGTGKNPHPEDLLAQLVPYWLNITYTANGQTETLTPPFLVTQNIFADAATGSCTGNTMEIVFNGAYNPEKVFRLEMTGVTATESFSGGSFTFTACMAPGSAAISVTAFDKDGKAIRNPLTVSVAAMTATKTLGFGHPRYPNTGFEIVAAGKQTTNGTVVMANVAAKKTASTGNTGFTMETGFVVGVTRE